MIKTIFSLLLFIGTLFQTVLACEHKFVVSYNGDWAPYLFKVKENVYDGIDYQLLKQTMDVLGCQLQVLSMRKSRADREIQKGTYDLMIGGSFTEERNKHFYFSHPYRNETAGFLGLTDSSYNLDTALGELVKHGAKVAVNEDGYFGENFELLKQKYPKQFVYAFKLDSRLSLLTSGKVNIIVDDRLALCQKASANPQYKVSSNYLHQDAIHFMVNRKSVSDNLFNQFNAALKSLITAKNIATPISC